MKLIGVIASVLLQDAGVDRLVEQLGAASVEVREEAESRLIELGPSARRAVEPLLRSADPERQARARRILKFYDWSLTRDARRELDALLEESRLSPADDRDGQTDDSFFLDVKLWKRWQRLGTKPVGYLLELHRATPHGPRRGQILYIASLSRDRSVLDAALAALKSPHPAVRHHAARACGQIGAAEAVPGLAKLLWEKPVFDPKALRFKVYHVSQSAAWAIQNIVGFPIDPEQWVDRIFPYHSAHHGIYLDVKRFQGWWERNRDRRTLREWREAAREDAHSLVKPSRSPEDRLGGCMLLMALGGEDEKLCHTVLDLCRRIPANEEDYRLRSKALGFFKSKPPPSYGYKGRPRERIQEILLRILQDEGCSSEWPVALGVAWRLYAGLFTNISFYGKNFSLEPLYRVLRERLDSHDPGTRYLAALTLGFMGEPKAERPLVEFLQTALEERARKRHPWLHAAATWTEARESGEFFERGALAALERVGTKNSQEVLRAYARMDRSCLAACRALAKLKDASIAPLLRPYLNAPEVEVPEGDHSAWMLAYTRKRDREVAFVCLYLLCREKALLWWRERHHGEPSMESLRRQHGFPSD